MHRLLTGLLLTLGAPAAAAPADDLKSVIADHWTWYLAGNPVQASILGDSGGDGKLGDPSLAYADRRAAEASRFVARLDAIDAAALTPADRVNRGVLRRLLQNEAEGNRFGARAITFYTFGSWHSSFAGLPNYSRLATRADYDSYIARLEAYPAYNRASLEVTRSGVAAGYVQPCVPMANFGGTITKLIAATPQATVWWEPFRTRPAGIDAAQWTALTTRGARAIEGGVLPALREFDAYYTRDYAPKCRKTVGARDLPEGAAWYAFRVRSETTTDLTPDAIHELGLSEVARIRAEMDAVVAKSGFKGDRVAYFAYLRTDPKFYAKTGDELMRATAATAKTIDGFMPKLFGKLPRLPYTVKPIPDAAAAGNTTAYYEPGSTEAGIAGVYRVNLTALDQRPLYELPALTVHEAVPGHHHQFALAQELDMPLFRRHAAYFTGFIEGWGLYSERLGIEMGLYDTPEKDMGRLSYEMWRACRLVVDTGLHHKGWDKARAVAFMTDNTALSAANIDAEVNRYITWPGQALAYKIGELTIRRLRTRAETELGPKFDLRAFHDAVLENGAVPLDVLEAHVVAWIAERKA